ncbi:hypothetical protein Ddye_019842 [Dipteronia dyeriana]|uniref:AAA+ ATPase domain-containing protein n=1 Tax=Dipteronia dyeriana TaxID=168575 RepID=A0AAD9TYU5_9ROSI|nr:hypothetical protein Ddye_019842 [Dipteronia dyeriana]
MAASTMVLDPKPPCEPPPSLPSTRSDLNGSWLEQFSSDDDDLYSRLKSLQRQLEFIDIQEEYVKDELKNLKRELLRAQEEVKRIQSVPLVIGQFMEMVDQNNGIVGSTTGSNYYVRILSTINRELLKPSASVALHRHSNALVDVLPPEADSSISLLSQSEKPDVTYNDIGGCDIQKQEIREAVELPLTHHELYKQIGIDPPRGVLLYGPPGTGKTMLAKAVANHTTAAFIRVVGSEFVQKYLGEGPRMVRDVFRLAKENAPAIIFIDEVDAIATARFDAQTGADREVQRILMELLNQMDGFDQTVNVKVIMATNRADTLDPALLRPGRLDRKIEFPLPDRRQKRLVFQVCTAKMNLSDEVDLEDYVSRPDKISAAEISAICQEAGMHAVRKNSLHLEKGCVQLLKRWERKLKTIESVLNDAEEKQLTDNDVKMWLDDLRDLAYDVEDILDEFATEAIRRMLVMSTHDDDHQGASSSTSKVRGVFTACCFNTSNWSPTAIKFNISMGSKIKSITSRMEELCNQKADFGLKEIGGKALSTSSAAAAMYQRPPTTCLPTEFAVYGRHEEKAKVLKMVLNDEGPSDTNFGVVPIVEECFRTKVTTLKMGIGNLEMYEQLIQWGLPKLTSLTSPDIVGSPDVGMMLPTSLTRLSILRFPKLKYLSSDGFQNLTSLISNSSMRSRGGRIEVTSFQPCTLSKVNLHGHTVFLTGFPPLIFKTHEGHDSLCYQSKHFVAV